MSQHSYCSSPWKYQRRKTRTVDVRGVKIGSDHPIRVQSMITCDTMDTEACVKQTVDLVKVGCELVRITAPTVKDAANLQNIKKRLVEMGYPVPLVADIHFKPEAAMEAAQWVDKIRINPGNFADKKKFQVREYTDNQYDDELGRIDECFAPLLKVCKERGLAMRIGTNHGSLSDRVMNRYGDTPLGMVESALEYARVARKYDFHNFVFSMKASNPKVMIQAYRLLVRKLQEQGEDWNYPIHLGVTEAGEGEDGRIKSAIGIGSLLFDGIGDTIRVSLTEDSIHEIPVAKALVKMVEHDVHMGLPIETPELPYDPFIFSKRVTPKISVAGAQVGETEPTRVLVPLNVFNAVEHKRAQFGDTFPDMVYEGSEVVEVDVEDSKELNSLESIEGSRLLTVKDGCKLSPHHAFRLLAAKAPKRHLILLKDTFNPPVVGKDPDVLETLLHASAQIGSLLCDGVGDAILVRGEPGPGASVRLAFNVLQGCGNRIFKTEYVACPSCGRTLFDLQSTTARIKASTGHLKGVKIAVMGCIVNGPGEMADADFGYVGGAPGKVNLYIGKTAVKFNIPEGEAVDRLVDLIKENNKWFDATPVAAAS
ncbi:MAG: (E)-4-hydroxy-3-methylbut-2-enyl-diphosphate synthase [Verrucomicrobiota bacterium]